MSEVSARTRVIWNGGLYQLTALYDSDSEYRVQRLPYNGSEGWKAMSLWIGDEQRHPYQEDDQAWHIIATQELLERYFGLNIKKDKSGEISPPIAVSPEPTITLVTDFNEEGGFWYFVVQEGSETLHFRPGFRTKEDATRIGDQWIRENLNAAPPGDN